MKKLILLSLITICFKSPAQVLNDTLLIKQTALNYVEGFYNADTLRIKKAMHTELVKRIVIRGDGYAMIKNTGTSELIYSALKSKKPDGDQSKEPFKADIKVYDITNNIAIAKISTNKFKFIDYLQLAKINNEWKIINVLWAFLP